MRSVTHARDALPAGRLSPEHLVGGTIGFGFGLAGSLSAWSLYPPTSQHLWPLVFVTIGTVMGDLLVWVAGRVLGRLRMGDAAVIGFGIAVLVVASLAIGSETITFLRDHRPWGAV